MNSRSVYYVHLWYVCCIHMNVIIVGTCISCLTWCFTFCAHEYFSWVRVGSPPFWYNHPLLVFPPFGVIVLIWVFNLYSLPLNKKLFLSWLYKLVTVHLLEYYCFEYDFTWDVTDLDWGWNYWLKYHGHQRIWDTFHTKVPIERACLRHTKSLPIPVDCITALCIIFIYANHKCPRSLC